MAKRIFKSIVFVAILVLMTSVVFISRQIYKDFLNKQIEELKLETKLLGYGIQRDGIDFLDNFNQYDDRITIIDIDGTVLFDNSGNVSMMDNHLDRKEVRGAIENGFGIETRYSNTLTKRLVYSAIKLNNGWIVRLSSEYSSIFSVILSTLNPLLIVALLMILLSSLLARNLTRKIIEPINAIDVDNPNNANYYKEIKPFMDKISLQQKQINENMISLERRKQEFETITENMKEGMVLLNSKGLILDVNKFASKALDIKEEDVGKRISELKCAELLGDIFAKNYGKKVSINNVSYKIETSPVTTDVGISGLVLLMFDNSYKEANEKLRKEFSSNVSHELKTPLQTITGYAELLKNNLVKPNDQNDVADRIYSESQRMISLINDIIKLSHLDDDELSLAMENVDLYTVTQAVIESVRSEANNMNIDIQLQGSNQIVYGNPQLLESIVFNLIDNAIKYNKENGSVDVNIYRKDDEVFFKVSDTGVGIAPEDYDRIFERFYQTDKARSKKVGGTGLGLSIVKHAVILNNAKITIDSKLNEGTTFTVAFKAIN